jgi:hypothetical protein
MSFLEGAGLVLGIAVAIGMLSGTTGTRGSARGRMTILAAVLGLLAGVLLAGAADLGTVIAALIGLAGAAIACVVISDLVSGAGRREGSGNGALGFLVSLAALVVVAAALLLPVLTLVALAGLLWLGAARHRRSQRKHAGLRVLR